METGFHSMTLIVLWNTNGNVKNNVHAAPRGGQAPKRTGISILVVHMTCISNMMVLYEQCKDKSSVKILPHSFCSLQKKANHVGGYMMTELSFLGLLSL